MPHRIEILGDRQQFLAYARHPRGTFYRWARGEPMQSYLVDLPEIDQAGAQADGSRRNQGGRRNGAPAPRQGVVSRRLGAGNFGEPEPTTSRRREVSGQRIDSGWQRLDPETLAKLIDAKHAARLKAGGWITSCPAHTAGEGSTHRSLSITPRDGGGSVVHCFGGCDFLEIAREIADIVRDAA